jgi:hypothetical protein
MMAPTLLRLSTFHKISHAFENFVSSPQMLHDEMPIMNLQKEMIQFIFLMSPVALLYILGLLLWEFILEVKITLGRLLPILFLTELDVALLSKE